MKNTPFSILACACLVLAAFLCGMYLGRNMTGGSIQISALASQSATQTEKPVASAVPGTSIPTSSASSQSNGKININTADLATLMTLKGIGEVYAQRIIDYRTANGPFGSIDELMKVEGIGAKRFEDIKNSITTGG